MLMCSHADQILRGKQAVELIYSLHQQSKLLTAEADSPATGTSFLVRNLTGRLGSIHYSYFRILSSTINKSMSGSPNNSSLPSPTFTSPSRSSPSPISRNSILARSH